MLTVQRGPKIAEGKTKILYCEEGRPGRVDIEQKDDITAGDGKKHDILSGKGAAANQTAVNIFKLLQSNPMIPVAFRGQSSATSFAAPLCEMLPLEVVVRRRNFGSFGQRNPHVPEMTVFPRLVLEFFLKTKGKQWNGMGLPEDDPYIRFSSDGMMNLYHPKKPLGSDWATGELSVPEIITSKRLDEIRHVTPYLFLILEKAFFLADGLELIDFKLEFGIGPDKRLYLADVVTPDEVRLLKDGRHESKEFYRRNGQLDKVLEIYQRVARATERFPDAPPQTVILWRGSTKDDFTPFADALKSGAVPGLAMIPVTCSMHKEAERGCRLLAKAIQEHPDAVVIAYVGRSNGAGPTLAAHTHAPVITVPAGWERFPEDVWSSLRAPSDVPVMTCLTPANAVLAALNIFAMKNPFVYAAVRSKLEARLTNTIEIA